MGIEIWHIWIIIAIILFITEVSAPNFIFGSFAIGSIFAGVASVFGGIQAQIIAFIVGALVAFFGIRPFALKYLYKKSDKTKTNVDALVGKTGRVVEAIDNYKNEGRIVVGGDNWKVEAENNEIVAVGKKVEILQVNSTILIVREIK